MKKILTSLLFAIPSMLMAQVTDTGGNVGIGITNPISKLEVNYGVGSASVPGLRIYGGGGVYENISLSLDDVGTASNNVNILEFKNSSYRSAIIKSVNPSGSNLTGGNLIFETTSNNSGTLNNNQLFLRNNGNIGIGTSNPTELLHLHEGNIKVFGYNSSRYLRFTEANLQGGFVNYDGTNNRLSIGVNNINSSDVSNDVNVINIVRSTANVGIGTTSPQNLLEVSGVGTDARVIRISNKSWTSNMRTGLEFKNGVAKSVATSMISDYMRGSGNAGGELQFWTQQAGSSNPNLNDLWLRMVIDDTGYVGIGTTTPDSKLTVAGNVHAQEVKVTINAGADFVFDENYQLPKLKELENFIKTNKHLPEIASAKEMETDGLELGEMNIKLLQKIEELTLYTIEQEKELTALKLIEQKFLDLQKRLEKLESESN